MSPRSGVPDQIRPENSVRRERQRIVAVAVGVLRDEQIVADQQRLLHRARRNVEGLEQKGADDERDDQRMEDDAHGLANAALFALRAGRHTHLPLVHAAWAPRRSSRWGGGAQ